MILGQSRTPFQRPAGASPGFQPKIPGTGFYSHFQPFTMVSLPMAATSMYRPPLPGGMGPVPLPDVPAPAPVVPATAPVAPVVPKAGGTAGFGGAGFGSTGGVRGHAHVDPYMVMRQGVIPGVSPSGANIRAGVRNAGQRVNRSLPYQTAALSPMPPPVVPALVPPSAAAPAMPATGVKGFLGALGDHLGFPCPWRRYGRRAMPAAAMACETIGPRRDGLMVTICNGQVVSYQDAQGNVRRVG